MVEPDAGAFVYKQPITLEIAVVRDKPTWGNFLLALLLLMAYPLFVMMRVRYFESRRWANSDYAPGASGKGGSDE